MNTDSKPLRIAAVADLHCTRAGKGHFHPLFEEASRVADVLLLCGDLTDYGLPEEAQVLAHDIRNYVSIPVLAVLGNHDYESGKASEVVEVLSHVGVTVLDGECCEIGGVGFAGVCGFGGGFGRRMLNPWGEPLIKSFVQEAIDQAVRLERALGRIESPHRVVLLHYSPIRETVLGEDPEIFPFLGSTRLEGPLNRFNVQFVFHGHAHNGQPEAHTSTGVPVFNVSLPILKRVQPQQPWMRIVEITPNQTLEPALTDPVI
ncbi:metallophosphoesterase [Chthoniobacter flavus Ellin428]|uniref:Metallophosphoesterase n=1 Tax=Chthoniobacter flavus Ellin428 TaxID=497964 RepID=B4DA19_9BACT|nr:metallophosphoesterase [Chthoniobacter flavus]EDY16646.1 metallophosphoesterase [Chthoniobacter flavus Ellin428]TCO87221.1 Icc-related predicted phosphoesterase [Chthoniobacter flavus]